jgi:chromosome segregation and condensation protein ScpB
VQAEGKEELRKKQAQLAAEEKAQNAEKAVQKKAAAEAAHALQLKQQNEKMKFMTEAEKARFLQQCVPLK